MSASSQNNMVTAGCSRIEHRIAQPARLLYRYTRGTAGLKAWAWDFKSLQACTLYICTELWPILLWLVPLRVCRILQSNLKEPDEQQNGLLTFLPPPHIPSQSTTRKRIWI